MSCPSERPAPTGCGYVIVIVLYILLAIILGSWVSC